MIYLDYSATTKAEGKVLRRFMAMNHKQFANPNSKHLLGQDANSSVVLATQRILRSLSIQNSTVVYTSGATEANNLAIIGYALANRERGNHLIVSPFEHSSVTACFGYLQKNGFVVDVLDSTPDGTVDLANLETLIRGETILVSIGAVHSELGIVQPIEEISRLLTQHPNVRFHSDMTQAIGKMPVSIDSIDLVAFSAHKFYGLKGIGALIVRKGIALEPILHGGSSTTVFRSGTPALPLIDSLALSLELAMNSLDSHIGTVIRRRFELLKLCNEIKGLHVNSPSTAIPHIVNLSLPGWPAEQIQSYLASNGIFVSTQTACQTDNSVSHAVLRLTGNQHYAESSIRVSLSHKTTSPEIKRFVSVLKAGYLNAARG